MRRSAHVQGVELRRGVAYDPQQAAQQYGGDYDVIIGADGAASAVRGAFFGAPVMSRVHQSSVILDFRVCPVAADKVGAADVASRVAGVSFVYRRFFGGSHCHVQVLLRDGVVNASDTRIPWDLVLRAVSHTLETRFDTVADLQNALVHSELLHQSVVQSRHTVRLVVDNVSNHRHVVLLTGDAVTSALYRLGIGLNNLLHAAADLRTFLSLLSRAPRPEWDSLVKQKNAIDRERQLRIAAFQERVIWMVRLGCAFAHFCRVNGLF